MGTIYINSELRKTGISNVVADKITTTADQLPRYFSYNVCSFILGNGVPPTSVNLAYTANARHDATKILKTADNVMASHVTVNADGSVTFKLSDLGKINATATDTTTYFAFYDFTESGYSPGQAITNYQIVGTVGAFGSGKDIEARDPNVVTGQEYFLPDITIKFPLSF